MFTWGLFLSNFSFAIATPSSGQEWPVDNRHRPPCRLSTAHCRPSSSRRYGAHDQNRTGDLVLTKDALCRLSYVGAVTSRVLRTTASSAAALSGASDGIRRRDIQP